MEKFCASFIVAVILSIMIQIIYAAPAAVVDRIGGGNMLEP